jgi:hypothetical protein
MKAHYRTANGRFTFEVEGKTQKDLFEGISDLQEVFEADVTCGLCNAMDLRFEVRTVSGFKFYELRCFACNARLGFSQSKDGATLFPKRKSETGAPLENRGWRKWQPEYSSRQE